jgi:hypothetical protein
VWSLNWLLTTTVDHNPRSLDAAEELVQAGQGVVPGFLVDVRVDLHRGRDVRVTEDHLRIARRHAELLEQ